MILHTVLYGATRYKRLSANGNPRYTLHTAHGDYSTGVDYAVGYDVLNFTRGESSGLDIPVDLEYTNRQRVFSIKTR